MVYYDKINIMAKELYIIAGANGSGKSTLAEIILQEKHLEFLNADEIAREISPNAIDKVPITAGKEYIKRLNKYFDNNKSFAVESTLSGKNIISIINGAKKQNYRIVLVYIFLNSCTVCIERVNKRVKNGGHSVKEEDIVRRYYRSVANFEDIYKDMVDEWMLFYNGLEYDPILVAYKDSENCDIIKEDLQDKFDNILDISRKINEQ